MEKINTAKKRATTFQEERIRIPEAPPSSINRPGGDSDNLLSETKVKNPILRCMQIMQLVTDTFKVLGESSKKTAELCKKEWEALSKKQSENFSEGIKKIGDANFFQYIGTSTLLSQFTGSNTLKTLGEGLNTLTSQYSNTETQKSNLEVQGLDAISQQMVAAINADYGNLSQKSSTDAQQKDGAMDKAHQLIRIQGQILTGSPA